MSVQRKLVRTGDGLVHFAVRGSCLSTVCQIGILLPVRLVSTYSDASVTYVTHVAHVTCVRCVAYAEAAPQIDEFLDPLGVRGF